MDFVGLTMVRLVVFRAPLRNDDQEHLCLFPSISLKIHVDKSSKGQLRDKQVGCNHAGSTKRPICYACGFVNFPSD